MRYKQNVLLKKPGGGLIKSGDEKGVATFLAGESKKLKISAVGLRSEKLFLRYSSGDFSITFPYSHNNDFEYALPDNAPPGGGVLIFDEENNAILYGAFSLNGIAYSEMINKADSPETPREEYDDEVVATENYYEYDKNLQKNGDNQLIGGLFGNDGGISNNENENFQKEDERESRAIGEEDGATKNENARLSFGEEESAEGNYYERIKGELKKLFSNKREENLSAVVKDSEWVKIPYGEGKHYVVGIIYERALPRWICYGVPGKYGERPQEIKDYCSFIPSSPFDLKGTGYWVMYQDAESGKIAK